MAFVHLLPLIGALFAYSSCLEISFTNLLNSRTANLSTLVIFRPLPLPILVSIMSFFRISSAERRRRRFAIEVNQTFAALLRGTNDGLRGWGCFTLMEYAD